MRSTRTSLCKLILLGTLPLLLLSGCASEKPYSAANMLAAASHALQQEAGAFKQQRDALAQARQMSINTLEQDAVSLENLNSSTIAFWSIPGLSKTNQKELLDTLLAQTEAVQTRQQNYDQLRADQERQATQAKSSVASVDEKLDASTKALASLGTEDRLGDQLQFYYGLFKDVNSRLQELRKQNQVQQQSASENATIQDKVLKSPIAALRPVTPNK